MQGYFALGSKRNDAVVVFNVENKEIIVSATISNERA